MRIRRATAHAFGPLTGASLELAEGLTVVYGPNESGKSSWHAALTHALCGLRRTHKSAEDLRYRPWRGDDWVVSAEIELADGRRIELRQDLDKGVAGYAKDLALGRDHAAEITGSERGEVPDASRWLGLDRRSFRATASVAQAQLAEVAERPEALREHLQRAAATAGADETAAAALRRIEDFQKEAVGGPTAHTRPLRRAEAAATAASVALEQARQQHAIYDARSAAVRSAQAASAAARARLRAHEAGQARAGAAAWRERVAEAAELSRLLDAAEALPDPALAAEVAAALAAWRQVPAGLVPDESSPVNVSTVELRELERVLSRPVGALVAVGASASRALALDLAPVPAPAPTGDVEQAQRRVMELVGSRQRALAMLGGGVLLVLVALVCLVVAPVAVAAVLGVLGLALAGTGFALARNGEQSLRAARTKLAAARAAADEVRIAEAAEVRAVSTAQAEWQAARSRCVELGLPTDPELLRLMLDERSGRVRDEQWTRSLAEARDRAAAGLDRVAVRVGLSGASPESLASSLDAWLAGEPEREAQREQHREWRVRLVHLLDGGTLDALRQRADAAARKAESSALAARDPHVTGDASMADGAERAEVDGLADVDDLAEVDEAALRRTAEETADAAARAEESLAAFAATLVPVVEAEERALAAASALDEIRDLDRILGLTHAFLSRAQDRVNREIAPRLGAAIGSDLALVTSGRYVEAIVDPQSLAVQVRGVGGPLRDASGLSHGTAEQVYLLLRVALAEHLVKPGESCPLLLDDVTVHADADRTRQILELLLAVAERHQVVLFSQERQVRDWAATHLTDPRHALRELTPVPVA
jgi:hypothetical protein